MALHRAGAEPGPGIFVGVTTAKFISCISDMEDTDVHSLRNFCIVSMASGGINEDACRCRCSRTSRTSPASADCCSPPPRSSGARSAIPLCYPGGSPARCQTGSRSVAKGVHEAMVTIGMTGLDLTVELWPAVHPAPRKRPQADALGACSAAAVPRVHGVRAPRRDPAPCGHVFCALCRPEIMQKCTCKATVTGEAPRVWN